MKTLALFLLLVALGVCLTEHAQAQSCGFNETEQVQLTQLGGAYMPSFGTVRALMIFVDFSDDTTDVSNTRWPVGVGPNYLTQIIDVNENQPSGLVDNITTYFKNMSFNNLRIIGTAVYRQARNTLAWYKAHPTYKFNVPYWATRHVIEHMDTTGFDFAPYDLWKRISVYNLQNIPDGVVDMIFASYRIWYPASGFIAEGYAHLGGGGTFSVDAGQRQVQSGYPGWNYMAEGANHAEQRGHLEVARKAEQVFNRWGVQRR